MPESVKKFLRALNQGKAPAPGTEPARPPVRPPDPARVFSIPEEVKYLEAEQLSALGGAFRAWYQAAGRAAGRQARGRVWAVYLLLRFSGARLGEVLALDETRDLDLERGLLRLGGAAGRQVQIPADVARELALVLAASAQPGLAGRFLALDQGYVRRQFQARAGECGLPRELANPRVLRSSRAIELLRQGLPLTIVQGILGQGTANLTAGLLSFAQEDVARLVGFHLQKETRLRTSARNSFSGRVTAIKRGAILCEVELVSSGGFELVSVITRDSLENLGLRRGSLVTALVKAPWVILVAGDQPPRVSARNRLLGRVGRVKTDAISAEVMVALSDGTQVCALVTRPSVAALGLEPGQMVWVVFKSSAVIITVD